MEILDGLTERKIFKINSNHSIEKMDIKIINERLENSGINNLLEFDDTDEYKDIYESFQNLIKTHENKRLMDL